MPNKQIKHLLPIGIFASILVGIGEYFLHFLTGCPGGEIDLLENVIVQEQAMVFQCVLSLW
jgi:hypothetical protein